LDDVEEEATAYAEVFPFICGSSTTIRPTVIVADVIAEKAAMRQE
jgi:hypothetical protein